MRTYVAIFKSQRVIFEASSMYEARNYALVHFMPRKRDAYLISVMLADTPINTASIG